MRAVIDHHVDRLDVDAQQCVKLTSTNRSIGLISHIACSDKQALERCSGLRPSGPSCQSMQTAGTTGYFIYSCITGSQSRAILIQHPLGRSPSIVQVFFLNDLVVIARGNTPDPIPNSAVKTLSADGTPS